MKQQINPAVVAVLGVVLVLLLGAFLIIRGRQGASEAENVAKKGESAGQKMMQNMGQANR